MLNVLRIQLGDSLRKQSPDYFKDRGKKRKKTHQLKYSEMVSPPIPIQNISPKTFIHITRILTRV